TPAMVADIAPGWASSNSQNVLAIGSTMYFDVTDWIHGFELWKSDGTAAGTTRIAGDFLLRPSDFTNVEGALYFTSSDGIHGWELWKSDGTTAGTVMVADISSSFGSNPTGLTNVNGTLFFSAASDLDGRELWRSDGTAAGTTMVLDIHPGTYTYQD